MALQHAPEDIELETAGYGGIALLGIHRSEWLRVMRNQCSTSRRASLIRLRKILVSRDYRSTDSVLAKLVEA